MTPAELAKELRVEAEAAVVLVESAQPARDDVWRSSEGLARIDACAELLPPPGAEVVHAATAEIRRLRDLLDRIPLLEQVLEAAKEYEAAYEGNGRRPDIAKRDLFAAIRAATEKT